MQSKVNEKQKRKKKIKKETKNHFTQFEILN